VAPFLKRALEAQDRRAVEHIVIDLGSKESQILTVTESELIWRTERERRSQRFRNRLASCTGPSTLESGSDPSSTLSRLFP